MMPLVSLVSDTICWSITIDSSIMILEHHLMFVNMFLEGASELKSSNTTAYNMTPINFNFCFKKLECLPRTSFFRRVYIMLVR
jgi:hypothetical protein